MRWLILLSILAFAAPARANEGDTEPQVVSVAPFRAALQSNATTAARASATFSSMAKMAAPSTMPKTQQKLYDEQSKWLRASATRLHVVHVKMTRVLAKSAGATEIAQTNMEFVHVRDEIEMQSHRYDATKTRSALKALK